MKCVMVGHHAVERRRAVVLGGAYGSLALARSLKAAGVDVWLVAHESRCASFSNAVTKVVPWCGPADAHAAAMLEHIARVHGLDGSLLIPAADPEVQFAARAHLRLASTFTMLVPAWEQLKWACDKSLLDRRARDVGVAVPQAYDRAALEHPELGQVRFPLVLKPASRVDDNRLTSDRAWRVDDARALAERYKDACGLMGAAQVIGQDLIPGDGRNQLSYAGLWNRGSPVTSMTARRLRQYPAEFGSTSTYVISESLPAVRAAAETFLRSIEHHGLVEVEFKRDPRDGVLKLLDVNPRPWNWLGLGAAAGMDLGAAIAATARGAHYRDREARDGVAWAFVTRDFASAAGSIRRGSLMPYVASWARVRKFACFSWADPVPSLVDVPATLARMVMRRFKVAAPPSPA
jgi:predicted ATP-grasp superfamily ATP-dependent carboligase